MDMRHRRTRSAFTAAALLFCLGAAGQAQAYDKSIYPGEGPTCTTSNVAVVPEPSTAALMSVAVAGLVGFGLRKKKRTD